jgi:hypothetical protein
VVSTAHRTGGALIHSDAGYGMGEPGLTVTLVGTLLTLLDTVDHQFAMVTP